MKAIVVTGVPATGKTKVAKLIAKLINAEYLDVNKIIKDNKFYIRYDRRLRSYDVKLDKLVNYLVKLIRNSKDKLVIDSHLSHYIPRKYVELCIVTKCNLKTLKKRLEKRGYPKNKVRQNLDAEIFDVCLLEAAVRKHKIKIVDTTKNIKPSQLMRILKK